MDISLIEIGNSKGFRLPNSIIKQYNFGSSFELIANKDHIILKPKKNVREGWDELFKKMHENGDDELLIPDVFEDETFDEWN